jgi:exodeoxyribonuclease V alpha subunit
MATVDEALERLSRSKFRSSFKLSKRDKEYINEKGMDTVHSHARDFVKTKLAPVFPENDGKQTAMSGHPVFKAMHATACCCRGCLNKWYNVPLGIELTQVQQEKIVNLIVAWIEKQIE